MNIQTLLKNNYQAYPQLDHNDLDSLLALSLKRSNEYLYRHPDKILQAKQSQAFRTLLNKFLAGYSVAHLAGFKYFFALKFLVNRHTLIPRPESELLVDKALEFLQKNKLPQAKIIDIGTGSGCLLLSVAKNYLLPATYQGVDTSSPALRLARTNARKLKLKNKVKFVKSNLFNNVTGQKFNLILANLPYLTKAQLKESSIKKEPYTALYGGKDGLADYRRLLKNIDKFLEKKYLVLLEIDPQQNIEIQNIIKKYLPNSQVNIYPDLAGHDRVVAIANKI